MFPELKDKTLFVFSDPGGAKPILALAEKHPNSLVVSDRFHAFYTDFKTNVTLANNNYEKIIIEFAPTQIVTGTSYRSDIEKQFHKLAHTHHIPCYAFIDHWTSMQTRFQQSDGSLIVPDYVWVIDERAKQLAIEACIPENKIIITGNPYHSWLAAWKPTISRETFIKNCGKVDPCSHILFFAPDPLSNINGQQQYGFDELSVMKELDSLFDSNEINNWTLVVKSHPNQNTDKLKQQIQSPRKVVLLPENTDTNTALYYADAVMGFFSNILIEANIMGKNILRYLPQTPANDPIGALRLGLTTNARQLDKHLQSLKIPAWN